MSETLNILMQSSDFYCTFAGVALESLFENNTDIENITVYLISDNISDVNLKKINSISQEFNRKIVIIDGNEISLMLNELGCPQYHGSFAPYYKMFALNYISVDTGMLLYIDSDIIVNGSFKELIDFDMQGNPLAMVIDATGEVYKSFVGFGLGAYYNTGAILIDPVKWRDEGVSEKILYHITNVRSQYPIVDQDIINVVMKDHITCLPLKYNFNTDILLYKNEDTIKKFYGVDIFYSDDEIKKAKTEVVIYHCFGSITSRPWCKKSKHPVTEKWDFYLARSPWHGYQKINDNRNMIFKIMYVFYKILPEGLFAFLSRIGYNHVQKNRG
ncbi:MAG: hypothetical protein K2G60_04825 [Oscillospiraceae bacterium]|nr:hypothetical protein [Oscillospiraceae bacterium]